MSKHEYLATMIDEGEVAGRLAGAQGDEGPGEDPNTMHVVCSALWGISGHKGWRSAVAYAETPESGDIHRMAVAHTKRLARATIAALRDAEMLKDGTP